MRKVRSRFAERDLTAQVCPIGQELPKRFGSECRGGEGEGEIRQREEKDGSPTARTDENQKEKWRGEVEFDRGDEQEQRAESASRPGLSCAKERRANVAASAGRTSVPS